MKKTLLTLGVVATAFSMSVMAQETSTTVDLQKGKDIFNNSCASCHGVNAEGQGMFPKLAGQTKEEIQTKLNKYRNGETVGPLTSMMAPMAMNLSDADVVNVSNFISTISVK